MDKEALKSELFEKYDYAGSAVYSRAFDYAWEQGHASGEDEVRSIFADMMFIQTGRTR